MKIILGIFAYCLLNMAFQEEPCVTLREHVFLNSEKEHLFEIIDHTCEIDSFKIRVLDRFGEEIFFSHETNFKWNMVNNDLDIADTETLAYKMNFLVLGESIWEDWTGYIKIH